MTQPNQSPEAQKLEQELVLLQDRFEQERDETKRMAIRALYKELHLDWCKLRGVEPPTWQSH